MYEVVLQDGSKKVVEANTSIFELAKAISGRLAKEACVATVNGEAVDLSHVIDRDCRINVYKFDDDIGKEVFRHTTAHVLAQAVKRLFPQAKLGNGPAIEKGFYYDFKLEHNFTTLDLEKIELEMKRIIKSDYMLERRIVSREEALDWSKQNSEIYKEETIMGLEGSEQISMYQHGEFLDVCSGPHLKSLKQIKAVKLLSSTAAYWKGDADNDSLQRIYGVSFPKEKLLKEHLAALEFAKERDHNKVGRELGLFMTNEHIGQGLPLFMPNGAKIMQLLQRFVEDVEEGAGYVLTKTPIMAKKDLYQMSGHWDLYKDGMFIIDDESSDDHLAIRPMTCPFQFMIYKATQKSYRDLPIRYAETATLMRNEASGEMHGLIRVRQFTISEGHLVVRPDQLKEEFLGVVSLIKYFMGVLGIEADLTYQFSKHDPQKKGKYIGGREIWEKSESAMRSILDELELDYVEVSGEAAFYGPKLDIQFKNVHGKEDSIITIQFDFALAERFGMYYIDEHGDKQLPIIIHRTSIGCYERVLALLIEKYAGKFPMWLSPVQVLILPIADRHTDYAYEVANQLKGKGIRVEVDARAEKTGRKIRDAQLSKLPYMLILGDQEIEGQVLAVRARDFGDMGKLDVESFLKHIIEEIENKIINIDL